MSTFARRLVASALLLGVCFAGIARAETPNEPDVIKEFMSHVEASKALTDQQKADVKKSVEELAADDYSRPEAITAGLIAMYPEYEAAILATQTDDIDAAIKQLQSHVGSDDKFLAADASFILARSLMNNERHEDALPILEKLVAYMSSHTVHVGPAMYFSGVAQANLLENQRAIQSFAGFLDSYPDAPERLRVAAWRQIQMIQAIDEGGMEDIYQRMDFSRRRLELEKTGDVTQTQQDKIVTMLAKMIKEAEKKECSSCNSKKNCEGQQESESQGQGQSDSQGKSNAGGASNNPNGVVRKVFDDGPASPWSRLRDRSRDAANNAIKEKLPARYRNVVDGYYEKTSGSEDDK